MGNPAACIYLEDDHRLSDEDMLSIAMQHKGLCLKSGTIIKGRHIKEGLLASYHSSIFRHDSLAVWEAVAISSITAGKGNKRRYLNFILSVIYLPD
ncbi:MAG: PhzF family phenazine biosynthesis protein [Syntrophomonadaceae bacterium]|jgi:hypothetical protein|nr:PhzF family phenazine biosynthesis protein [Syntrophomonadaceae bacterium]